MNLKDKNVVRNYIESNADSTLFPLLAEHYIHDEEYEDAIRVCQEGLRNNANMSVGHYMLALAEIENGAVEDGIKRLQYVIQLDPGFLGAFEKLVQYGQDIIEPPLLAEYYERIITLNPIDEDAPIMLRRLKKGIAAFTSDATRPKRPAVSAAAKPAAPQPRIQIDESGIPPATPEREFTESTAGAAPPPAPEVENKAPGSLSIEPEEPPSDIRSMFARLRSKPLEDLQKEDWSSSLYAPEPAAPEAQQPEPALEPEPEPQLEMPQEQTESLDRETIPPGPEGEDFESIPAEEPEPQMEMPEESAESTDEQNAPPPAVEEPRLTVPEEPEPTLEMQAESPQTVSDKNIGPEAEETVPSEEPVTPTVSKPEPKVEPLPSQMPETASVPKVEKPKPKATAPKKSSKAAPKAAKKDEKVDLKIPIPTLTLVEVLRKQKLYDQALEVLKVLEEKSKDVEKVTSVRQEILEQKSKET